MKEETLQKISVSPLVKRCVAGDRQSIENLIVFYWRFVLGFPPIIYDKYTSFRLRAGAVVAFVKTGAKMLAGMKKDEEDHRELWVLTAKELGIYDRMVSASPIPEVEAISALLRTNDSPENACLRFVAVEFVAESLSRLFLSSDAFKVVVNEKGQRWFLAHLTHESIVHEKFQTIHEELAFRLALEYYGKEATREWANPIIQETVDSFIAAAVPCMQRLSGKR